MVDFTVKEIMHDCRPPAVRKHLVTEEHIAKAFAGMVAANAEMIYRDTLLDWAGIPKDHLTRMVMGDRLLQTMKNRRMIRWRNPYRVWVNMHFDSTRENRRFV